VHTPPTDFDVAIDVGWYRCRQIFPAYQRTETADSGVTLPTVASYRNVDLCKTDANRTQNREKSAQNGADRGKTGSICSERGSLHHDQWSMISGRGGRTSLMRKRARPGR